MEIGTFGIKATWLLWLVKLSQVVEQIKSGCLLVCTTRPQLARGSQSDSMLRGVRDWYLQLQRLPTTSVLCLQALTLDETRDLIEHMNQVGDRWCIEWVHIPLLWFTFQGGFICHFISCCGSDQRCARDMLLSTCQQHQPCLVAQQK